MKIKYFIFDFLFFLRNMYYKCLLVVRDRGKIGIFWEYLSFIELVLLLYLEMGLILLYIYVVWCWGYVYWKVKIFFNRLLNFFFCLDM